LPTLVLGNKTPYELLMKSPPSYDHLRIFGYLAFTSNPFRHHDKFQPRGVPCLFLDYPSTQKGYKLFNMLTKPEFVLRDVKFIEHLFPSGKVILSNI